MRCHEYRSFILMTFRVDVLSSWSPCFKSFVAMRAKVHRGGQILLKTWLGTNAIIRDQPDRGEGQNILPLTVKSSWPTPSQKAIISLLASKQTNSKQQPATNVCSRSSIDPSDTQGLVEPFPCPFRCRSSVSIGPRHGRRRHPSVR